MKFTKWFLVAALNLAIISGCGNDKAADTNPDGQKGTNSSGTETVSTPESADHTQAGTPKQLDLSSYFVNQREGEVESKNDSITWTSGEIKLTATKIQSEEKGPDSNSLSEIMIIKGEQSIRIQPKYKALYIGSVSLSSDEQWLAVSLFYGAGSNLQMVNLSTGDVVDLNNELENQGNGFVETIHAYNWSPNNHDLAMSYGDTSSSRIAIYHADDKKLTLSPSSTSYISTAYVLWLKDGKTVDYVSEKPSDQFKLYRFDIANNKIDEVTALTRDDLTQLTDLKPATN